MRSWLLPVGFRSMFSLWICFLNYDALSIYTGSNYWFLHDLAPLNDRLMANYHPAPQLEYRALTSSSSSRAALHINTHPIVLCCSLVKVHSVRESPCLICRCSETHSAILSQHPHQILTELSRCSSTLCCWLNWTISTQSQWTWHECWHHDNLRDPH